MINIAPLFSHAYTLGAACERKACDQLAKVVVGCLFSVFKVTISFSYTEILLYICLTFGSKIWLYLSNAIVIKERKKKTGNQLF